MMMMHSSSQTTRSANRQRQQIQTTQQQHQQQQHHQHDTVYPYRDDPSAPASVRLESYTVGGYGPMHSRISNNPSRNNSNNDPNYYSNSRQQYLDDPDDKLIRSCWHSISYQIRTICQSCCFGFCCSNPNQNSNNQTSHNQYYYEDHFNDLSYTCRAGTSDEDGIWLNRSDFAGTIMSCLVWFLIGYSALTMTLLAQTGGIRSSAALMYMIVACLALTTHVKTTLTDPGAVPASAVPTEEHRNKPNVKLSMCSQCQTYKPPGSHHCRICNRCISRMDHHCPWMNNCVGAGNLKHFVLFLVYTWFCSVLSLAFMGYNYFFCADEECTYNLVLTQLTRIMTVLSVGAFLFTSSMLMNVVYGIMTGIGTIDRLKKKATGTMADSDEEAIPLKNIFGIGPIWEWFLPIDPTFEDYDVIMGYATPQRYLREQMMRTTTEFNNYPNYHHQDHYVAKQDNNYPPPPINLIHHPDNIIKYVEDPHSYSPYYPNNTDTSTVTSSLKGDSYSYLTTSVMPV